MFTTIHVHVSPDSSIDAPVSPVAGSTEKNIIVSCLKDAANEESMFFKEGIISTVFRGGAGGAVPPPPWS